MKHDYVVKDFSYRLRPVTLDDAQFIIDTRLEDDKKSKFLHPISFDVEKQKEWIQKYFVRAGDYYFVVENIFTGESEGLISIYDIHDNKGELGRWVFKRSSLGANEGVNLLYKFAFQVLKLSEVYIRTIADNVSCVNFHKNYKAIFRDVSKDACELNGIKYDIVEQYSDYPYYLKEIEPRLEVKAIKIFENNLKIKFGKFLKSHNLIFTKSIEDELKNFNDFFEIGNYVDEVNRIKGLFISSKVCKTKFELIQNANPNHLKEFLMNIKPFLENDDRVCHSAYKVDKIEDIYKFLIDNFKAKVIFELK